MFIDQVGMVPHFYKHFVPPVLKTTTENQNFLYCDDFKNATLDRLLIWSPYFLNHSNL